jgi:hypothetical protein
MARRAPHPAAVAVPSRHATELVVSHAALAGKEKREAVRYNLF